MSETKSDKQRRGAAGASVGIYGLAVVLTVVGFLVAYQFVEPAPPRTLRIATGSESGAYHRAATEYRELLAQNGVTLELVPTSGTVENLRLLLERSEDGPRVAFAQSGVRLEIASGEESEERGDDPGVEVDEERQKEKAEEHGLLSLASVFYEPLWLVYRDGLTIDSAADLRGKRIAIGAEGSGTRTLALQLLADNELPLDTTLDLGGNDVVEAFRASRIDAAFVVAGPQSAIVESLLALDGLRLLSFDHADAYVLRHRFLSKVVLPQGVIDLVENVPENDTILISPAATLVARDDVHPAHVDLLLQAASKAHGRGGMFERRGEFPSPDYLSFPLSTDAERYFKNGPPFLQKFLPFWAASLIDRLKVMLLPFIFLMFPLFKIVPPVYSWRIRSRIYRWYRELHGIDERMRQGASPDELVADLDRVEEQVRVVAVPLSRAHDLYDLRLHIAHLRATLKRTTESG